MVNNKEWKPKIGDWVRTSSDTIPFQIYKIDVKDEGRNNIYWWNTDRSWNSKIEYLILCDSKGNPIKAEQEVNHQLINNYIF